MLERVAAPLSVGLEPDGPAPAYLPPLAREEWRRVLKLTAESHPSWLQRLDSAALEGYVVTYALWRGAAESLAKGGVLAEGRSSADRGRIVKHPALVAYRGLSAELRSWIAVLGFSPDGRGKVDLGPAERTKRDDDARRLLS